MIGLKIIHGQIYSLDLVLWRGSRRFRKLPFGMMEEVLIPIRIDSKFQLRRSCRLRRFEREVLRILTYRALMRSDQIIFLFVMRTGELRFLMAGIRIAEMQKKMSAQIEQHCQNQDPSPSRHNFFVLDNSHHVR